MALKDIYKKASLVMKPAAVKTGKLYSQQPHSGNGDFKATVSANGTIINKDGLIEKAKLNTPRLSYELDANGNVSECPYLLLEPTRTNIIPINNSLTSYSKIGVETTDNASISPSGASDAMELKATTSGTAVSYKGVNGTSGVTHNISAFVKAGTHNQIRLQEGFSASRIDVNLSTGTEVSSQNATNKKIEAYPNDWYRISFNFTSTSTNLQFALYLNGSYTSGENIYLYGGQIEEGTYATSPITTDGSSVQRLEDDVYGAGDANLFSGDGTIFLDIEPFTHLGDRRISLSDSSINNKIFFSFVSSTQVRMGVYEAPNLYAQKYQDISYNTRIKLAVTYKLNEFKFAFNGSVVHTDTLGEIPPRINQLRLSAGGGLQKFQGKVFQTAVFNEALTDSELQELTTI